METGTKISLVAHGTLIGLAMFGGPFLDSDDTQAVQISEVSLMTSAEFEAMSSHSPAPQFEQPEQIQAALQTEESIVPPSTEIAPTPLVQPTEEAAPTLEQTPDVTGLQRLDPPDINVEVDGPNIAPQANDSVGVTLAVPDSPVAQEETDGQRQPTQLAMMRPTPRPAPRIDKTVAEKPPTDAETAKEAQQSTTPDTSATQQAEQSEEQAPKESATEIVTDPEVDPNSTAPAKSSRPRGRPRDIARKAQQAKDNAEKAAKAVAAKAARRAKEAEAAAIRDALIKATSEQLKTAPSGPPLTSSDRSGLVFAVQQCWNVPSGLENAADLVVVLSVELKPNGGLAGMPVLISSSGGSASAINRAFEAGRRALIRCAPYDLPQEKYEQWRQLEVVFNPETMVVK